MKGKHIPRRFLPVAWPWWGSVVVATVSYCGLKYGITELHPDNPALQQIIQAAPSFAPILAIPWLLLAAKQLYDTDGDASRQQDQKPPE